VPKPVVPVVDRPFLRHQLDLLGQAGVTEVVFSVEQDIEKASVILARRDTREKQPVAMTELDPAAIDVMPLDAATAAPEPEPAPEPVVAVGPRTVGRVSADAFRAAGLRLALPCPGESSPPGPAASYLTLKVTLFRSAEVQRGVPIDVAAVTTLPLMLRSS